MKKTVKIGFLLLILGIILVIFGVANNGIKTVYWHNGFHVAKHYVKTSHPSEIKQITLKTGSDVIVRSGSTNSVRVTSTNERPTIKNDHGHVTISSKSKNYSSFNFQLTTPVVNQTIITVAKNTKLDQLTAGQAQIGDVRLSGLTIDKLTAQPQGALTLRDVTVTQPLKDLTAYDAHFTRVTAPSLTVKSDGDLTIDQSQFEQAASSLTSNDDMTMRQTKLKSGQINSSASDVSLVDNQLLGQLTVKSTDSDIHVKTDQNNGINAHTDTGDLSIFGWHSDTQKSYQHQIKASQQYRLISTNGDITVTDS
ncbi:DUF4097 family beta strand repeat-containing protein [Lactiplantibacillus sp. WILCCON 0030]|uniref:DUF4097 family beta strand repeat-containing protein n=1 Tax=Lactiplantibacillus brownii TaxID=3069269 RepID=A0ABU1ABU9_9LACO|nr:DUF4097 family beta strand repeat-containing protein [Lactiplantibacillus brownii]MDQ7938436.1 DUF4097 family beta strand repeat-containing protein [Lactiplantibacillus brownii]